MRKTMIVSKKDWDKMVSAITDGDVQDNLALDLESTASRWETEPANVEYLADELGRIDSESSPAYTDDPADQPVWMRE